MPGGDPRTAAPTAHPPPRPGRGRGRGRGPPRSFRGSAATAIGCGRGRDRGWSVRILPGKGGMAAEPLRAALGPWQLRDLAAGTLPVPVPRSVPVPVSVSVRISLSQSRTICWAQSLSRSLGLPVSVQVSRSLCLGSGLGLCPVWVNTVWDLDFTDTEPLDSCIAEKITDDGLDNFTSLYSALSPFAAEDSENRENIWTVLAESSLSHQALVAVLHHFVHAGQDKRADAQQRVYGLHAAGLYFLLLEIPGSIGNQLFHEVMFDKCLHTLTKCWPQELRGRKKTHSQSSQSNPGQNRKKGKRRRNNNSSMEERLEEEEEEEEEEENDEHVYFSTQDLLQIRNAVFLLLKNFLKLLPKFSLKEKPHCFQSCLKVFVEMANFEPEVHEFQFSSAMDVNEAKNIPELAYYGLYSLCSPLHSTEDKALHYVFYQMLYVILMVKSSFGSKYEVLPITSAVTSARNRAVKFISSLVDELKEAVFRLLRTLLQHICVKVPDKADYRTYAAQALVTLLNKLPRVEFAEFIAWLYKFSLLSKTSYRVFALDVALALLDVPERSLDDSLPLDHQRFLKHKFLVQVMVFGPCSDKAPAVRSKALSSLAHCLEMKSAATLESIRDLVQSSSVHTVLEANTNTANGRVSAEAVSNHPQKALPAFRSTELTDSGNTAVLEEKEVMAMLRERAGDEKTNVRKSALQVLTGILKHEVTPCSAEDLLPLQERCRDPAVSVRKQSLQSITELLLSQHSNVLVQKAWLNGVVPVVMDAESSVQEKALEYLDQLLLQHIKPYQKFRSDDVKQGLAWDLLTLLSSECQELNGYLSRAFSTWSQQNKFTPTFIRNLLSHVETERAVAAWMLLAEVTSSSPRMDYSEVIESWDSVGRQQNTSAVITRHVLCAIGHVAKHLPKNTCERLIDNIKCWLKEFQWPLEVMSPAVETLQKLCRGFACVSEKAQELLNQVFGDLVSTCESYISNIVLKEDGAKQLQEDLLVRHLLLLGHAAQQCPARVGEHTFLLVQSILASVDKDQLAKSLDSEESAGFQPLSQFRGSTMPSVVRAHAFIALGKLCLQHEELAKNSIAPLARELEVSQDVAVRNNVIIVLCDLCIRYTSMVDRYIPNVSLCLKDPSPLIRKQTLILLTNLLQEEYVKWKDGLFFRFVSVLVDPVPDIARFTEFCLAHLLLKRNPVMFSQHFIECIFHFNSYEKHGKYNRFPQSARAKHLFSLKGKDNREKRMQIYTFLLEHFTDEQRFRITTKISDSILACFVDGVLPLDVEADELLSDTFTVLSCKEIKLSTLRSKPEEDLETDEDEMTVASTVVQVAQKKLISQVQKKNLIENIIPVITALKSLMEEKRMAALKDLMNYLRETMQDYRTEIKDIFAADKRLAAELEYDMRKYEEQLAREEESGHQQVLAAQAEVVGAVKSASPSLEGAAPLGGQNNTAQPPGSVPSSVPSELAAARAGALKEQFLGRRARSLNTLAILNSAKKAVEEQLRKCARRSLSAASSTASSKHVSFQNLNGQSSGDKVALAGRAISTPEQTIDDVSFGAGVSRISLTHTPRLAPGKSSLGSPSGEERGEPNPNDQTCGFFFFLNTKMCVSFAEDDDEDKPTDIICLPSPEEPPAPPRQWNVESPARRRSSQQAPPRRSHRKASQKPKQ
ncbi:condensin-2 complex subunit D3 [Empidonax traillii]|uniref:condensin-2 complex subunit D3 n=1 Tax=Empidonax traillii TaxID=164674 RepID=UPI000FFCE165|nr:condensin-2 complex subunit D3 [Empidonax traillii]